MALEAIKYSAREGEKAVLQLLDQRLLPLQSTYIDIDGPKAAWDAIRDMAVRGAPAIAIAGALSLAVDVRNTGYGSQFGSASQAQQHIDEQLTFLVTSRPTAVNLADAAQKLGALAKTAAADSKATAASVTQSVVAAIEQMLVDDVEANKTKVERCKSGRTLQALLGTSGRLARPDRQAMGQHGADAMLSELESRSKAQGRGLNVLTHCNTGSLATAGFGTALGVVRSLHQRGSLKSSYCTETRPYNQGSRLTAYELVHDGLPATLIADSAAASLMAAGRVDAVVVGADRVAANGDTANKIGTFSLAVNAAHHGIPFYIAAPTTTLDPKLAHGGLIEIEERSPTELTHHQGIQVAASGINVWNPAFDVTPAALITGVVTERGLVPKGSSGFDVRGFMREQGLLPQEVQENGDAEHVSSIPGFYALDLDKVKDYLAERPSLCKRVGPAESKVQWQVREVGDGNINYVYIVEGPAGAVVVKQGLPYIRIAHSWGLTQDRARIEAQALEEEGKHCPEHVPALYHFDAQLALIVIEYLPPPHDILRRAITAGHTLPRLSAHVASFLARTLFRTSLLALDSAEWRRQAVRYQNTELCRLTEQVIFTDPYYSAPVNRHTSPQLDDFAARIQEDTSAKAAATRLKALFCERQQALLHGDLHTGSFMVTDETTYAIDAEFACYGPIAFDVCKMIANLLLAFFASDGLASAAEPRHEQRRWLLKSTEEIWDKFRSEFTALWDEAVSVGQAGDLNHPGLFSPSAPAGTASLKAVQEAFFYETFRDTLSFAGAVMLRRILGIAHIIDFDTIQDDDARAVCELRALKFGRVLLIGPTGFPSMQAVTKLADTYRQDRQQPYYALQ